ncbi:hypothetical protein OOJ09_16400 [Mesorhizobium qingshengii]|uniref:Uncharacterized protein n=1 Tax=Mesorhizobium qingshengii TaxID=1165689 RepID=A0ABT4QW05_9HYPH|nr:hypothetical protein [Mesorhizobium qingshengii]MCZ8545774.1 hypothetical protein [Mesorhizobium qingshengii]
MVFDFNLSISGYDLASLQTAVVALVEDQGREPQPGASALQFMVSGEVQFRHGPLIEMHEATWD